MAKKGLFSGGLFGGPTNTQNSLFRTGGVSKQTRAARARAGHQRRHTSIYSVNRKGVAPYRKSRGHIF